MDDAGLTEEQKEYLAGFVAGAGLQGGWGGGSAVAAPPAEAVSAGPDQVLYEAQQRFLANGKTLVAEEQAKRERHPLDRWDELVTRSQAGEFPKGVEVFLTKTFGFFQVAPAQNSYMCRLRIPGGVLSSHQFRGIADVAEEWGGGYTHVTTRANLQIREIGPQGPPEVYTRLVDLGIVTKGSGADNLRNITASPTAGIDPHEFIDTLPLARRMHHHILNNRDLYHLPRKFNIAFDGGGAVSALADTNDIGFLAVKVSDQQATPDTPPGVYFRVQLGGITGHCQFAADVGWLLRPEQCVPVATAMVRVFTAHGNRTDRKRARLKYLLDDWGVPRFLEAVCQQLGDSPKEWPLEHCTLPPPAVPGGHLGFHPQSQPGKHYVGVVIPVGYLACDTMRSLAQLADRYGSGTIRLTCWQNLIISDLDDADLPAVQEELAALGLDWRPHAIRAGLVACTGNAGCKFAASNTKRHALEIAEHVEQRVELDQPVNIHLTGCHHSCAQHYIGDIGLIAAKVEVPRLVPLETQAATGEDDPDETDEVEGYHLFVGGGFGARQGLARELFRDLPASDVPQVVERMLARYLELREPNEAFVDFTRRHDLETLRAWFGPPEAQLAPSHQAS